MKINILNQEMPSLDNLFVEFLHSRNVDLEWLNAGENNLLDGSLMRDFARAKDFIDKVINEKLVVGLIVD